MLESKIVVFDLDETLGHFTQLCIIWDSINTFLKNEKSNTQLMQDDFNKLLNEFPEYIRPNIESILQYLINKKSNKKCKHVMIYTNNKRHKNWVYIIKKYFENKMKSDIFDQIICAFKINGKNVEFCRSTHNKTHKDLINCSKIPNNTQICFIDDTYFSEMHHDNVYYIKVKPYIYCLSIDTIINRIKKTSILEKYIKGTNISKCIDYIKEQLIKNSCHNKTKSMTEYDIDKIISKQIMNHIESFFNNQGIYPCIKFDNMNKTKKNKIYKNKTQRLKD